MLTQATMAHYEALCLLYQAACESMEQSGLDLWHWGLYPSPDILREDIGHGWLYMAMDGDTILGCLALNDVGDPAYAAVPWQQPGRVGYFHRVAVSPMAQGRGVAGSMMASAQDILRAQGYAVMRGDVSTLNPKAQRLYARVGMAQVGQLYLEGVGAPFWGLEKKL